jgi:hypothetical protein
VGPAERVRGPVVTGATVVRGIAGLAVVSAGALLLAVIWTSQRDAVPVDDPGDMVRVGVVRGQSVPAYLRSARAELAALADPSAPVAGDTWALVSLAGYVPPGELPDLLSGTAVAQVFARVPIAGTKTPTVRIPVYRLPADALSGMLDAAVQRDRERAEYLQLSDRLGAGEGRARRAYESAARTAEAEAAAYRTGCACLFAVVVRAAPAALQQVADRPGVRAVDPAPELRRLDRAEFRPLLPEQVGTVRADPSGSPQPVPTETSDIAPHRPTPILSSLGSRNGTAIGLACRAGSLRRVGRRPILDCPGGVEFMIDSTSRALRALDSCPRSRPPAKRSAGPVRPRLWSLG